MECASCVRVVLQKSAGPQGARPDNCDRDSQAMPASSYHRLAVLLLARPCCTGSWNAGTSGHPGTSWGGGGGFNSQPDTFDYRQSGLVLGAGQRAPDAAPLGRNPFEGTRYYVNAEYQERVREAMGARWAAGRAHKEMLDMLTVPSAFWVDRIAKIRRSTAGRSASLESLLDDAATKQTPPPLVVVILYDLPNRDCHAFASNGEVCCEYMPDGSSCNYETTDATCGIGLRKYKNECALLARM